MQPVCVVAQVVGNFGNAHIGYTFILYMTPKNARYMRYHSYLYFNRAHGWVAQ